jgi:hypothetical protein
VKPAVFWIFQFDFGGESLHPMPSLVQKPGSKKNLTPRTKHLFP